MAQQIEEEERRKTEERESEQEQDEVIPAVQRYLIAWATRERHLAYAAAALSTMIANEYDTRAALAQAPHRCMMATLLDGGQFKVCIAPNGRDIMVLPWEDPHA